MTGYAVLQLEKTAQKWLFRLRKQRHVDRSLTSTQHRAQSNHQKFVKVVQTPCTSGNSTHENRDTSEMPEEKLVVRPAGEGESPTSRMHVSEESDSAIVPMSHSNKSGKPPAESEEGRALIKENTHRLNTCSTQSEIRVSQGLAGVRKAARERKEMTHVLHPYPRVRFDAIHPR